MIVLDTNVLSELMRGTALTNAEVAAWFSRLDPAAAYTTSVAIAEIWSGLAVMPDGRRRAEKATAIDRILDEAFDGRILPFDTAAARSYAWIIAERRRRGFGAKALDVQIAAIAHVHGMAVATRNVRDFEYCGVDIVDPWTA